MWGIEAFSHNLNILLKFEKLYLMVEIDKLTCRMVVSDDRNVSLLVYFLIFFSHFFYFLTFLKYDVKRAK